VQDACLIQFLIHHGSVFASDSFSQNLQFGFKNLCISYLCTVRNLPFVALHKRLIILLSLHLCIFVSFSFLCYNQAFDRGIDHGTLFCFMIIIKNSYQKLDAVVRLKGVLSFNFSVPVYEYVKVFISII